MIHKKMSTGHEVSDAYEDPEWRVIGIEDLEIENFLPGVSDGDTLSILDSFAVNILGVRCPVCRADVSDPCWEEGTLVSHRPGDPHHHQARWDRAFRLKD